VLQPISVYQPTKEGRATLVERRGPAGEVCAMKPAAR